MKVELDLFNYAKKADLKNATGVDASKLAKTVDLKSNVHKSDNDKLNNVLSNLSNLESKVDKVYVDKLVTVLLHLSKLNDVVKNDVVKKDVYYAQIKNIEEEILDITNLDTNTTLNSKKTELKGEIPNIINLATTTALNAKTN